MNRTTAIRQMLAVHEGWLRQVIAARVRGSDAIDEVFQEVSLAAIENGFQIRDREKTAAWLYRVAVNRSIRFRRRHARRRRHETAVVKQNAEHDVEVEHEIPIQWLLAKERQQMLQKALEQLPARDADVLRLKYFEGWSYQQLADRLGVNIKAIDNRLCRARRRLRALLKQNLGED